MYYLSSGEISIIGFAAVVVGCILGYVAARVTQHQRGAARKVEALEKQHSDYRDSVTSHFQDTAELLEQMTAQYRAVYQHMADGAQSLCDVNGENPQLEQLQHGLPSAERSGTNVERVSVEASGPEAIVSETEEAGPATTSLDDLMVEEQEPETVAHKSNGTINGAHGDSARVN
ncbi:MAG: DUF1043 family protein [Pseudomonadota bacterium]